MALKAYALTTVNRQADFMGISRPAEGNIKYTRLEMLINSATDFIEKEIGYRVKKTTYTQELIDANDGIILTLKNFPIIEGETFLLQRRTSGANEDSWQDIDTDYYFVDYDTGIIQAASYRFYKGNKGYRATYVAGYDYDNSASFLSDTNGGDLELACWMLVAALFNRSAGGSGIEQESIGDYSVKYKGTMMKSDEIKDILDKYRRLDAPLLLTPENIWG